MRRRLLGSEESASAYEDPSEGVGAAKGGAQPSTLGVVGHQWCAQSSLCPPLPPRRERERGAEPEGLLVQVCACPVRACCDGRGRTGGT